MMRAGLDSRSKPVAESCNAAITVEDNTLNSAESNKIVKFLLLDFAL